MPKTDIDKKISKARKDYDQAREEQAIGAEYANDYLYLQGIKFFKPTFAHGWVLKRLRRSAQMAVSLNDFAVCVAYTLTFEVKLVRNKIMNEISNNQIVKRAYDWLIDNEIKESTVAEVFEKLADPVFNGDEEEPADGEGKEPETAEQSLSGGPE
ncbi:MAG: hypothetical protein PHH77_07730 [Victivallaceae bacterium]|nr:hypothetical protein [Victivallaceae bacterium]